MWFIDMCIIWTNHLYKNCWFNPASGMARKQHRSPNDLHWAFVTRRWWEADPSASKTCPLWSSHTPVHSSSGRQCKCSWFFKIAKQCCLDILFPLWSSSTLNNAQLKFTWDIDIWLSGGIRFNLPKSGLKWLWWIHQVF